MKRIFLIALCSFCGFSSFGQGELQQLGGYKNHKNEFGFDVMPLVKEILDFQQFNSYFPRYYLSYRRHFKKGSIRFAIGGHYSKDNLYTLNYGGDSMDYYRTEHSVDLRLGWEFHSELSKRWQVFYGLDFRPTFSFRQDDASGIDSGYARGYQSKIRSYGVAPVLGIRLRITNRLSLVTEASYVVSYSTEASKQIFTPISDIYPAKQAKEAPVRKALVTGFQAPLTLFVTFDL